MFKYNFRVFFSFYLIFRSFRSNLTGLKFDRRHLKSEQRVGTLGIVILFNERNKVHFRAKEQKWGYLNTLKPNHKYKKSSVVKRTVGQNKKKHPIYFNAKANILINV